MWEDGRGWVRGGSFQAGKGWQLSHRARSPQPWKGRPGLQRPVCSRWGKTCHDTGDAGLGSLGGQVRCRCLPSQTWTANLRPPRVGRWGELASLRFVFPAVQGTQGRPLHYRGAQASPRASISPRARRLLNNEGRGAWGLKARPQEQDLAPQPDAETHPPAPVPICPYRLDCRGGGDAARGYAGV